MSNTNNLTEEDVQDLLIEAIENAGEDNVIPSTKSVRPFREVGMLTNNSGVVVRFRNGQAFALTITEMAS